MSQFPEITSNLSTANWRASVLTMLQAIYTNANTEAPPVTSGGITGTTSVTAGSVNAYVVNTIDTATLGFSTTTTATGGTISIYGSVDGVNYLPTSYAALSSGNSSGTFNAATQTIGQINCVGLVAIAFKANAVTGGSVVVTTIGTNAVSNVMLDNPLPSGTNVIGGVTLPAASAPVYGQQTSTGTATALPSNTLTSGIVLTNIGTTNAIWVGGSGLTTSNGYSLAAGASVGLVVSNTSSIYILQNTGASTLSFIGS
jgi:hypothetical protein